MYYSDNADFISVEGVGDGRTVTLDKLVKGASAYLKRTADDQEMLVATTPTEGKYAVIVIGSNTAQTWWVAYKIPASDVKGIGPILKNKAERMELKKATTSTTNDYDGTDTIYMKVRGQTATTGG